MIIERKYLTLKSMCEKDPNYKKIVYENLENVIDIENINTLLNQRLIELEMGCGLSGEGYSKLQEYCNEMDKTNPFDNGYNIADINDVEITYKDEKRIQVTFYNMFDGIKDIVMVKDYLESNGLNS